MYVQDYSKDFSVCGCIFSHFLSFFSTPFCSKFRINVQSEKYGNIIFLFWCVHCMFVHLLQNAYAIKILIQHTTGIGFDCA